MRIISALLVSAVVGSLIGGAVKLRHDDFLTGTQLIGWALIPLALLLGFTWPVRCRVKTTSRRACGNHAYGFLFGCTKVAGHWTGKFLVRLRLRTDETKPVERRQPIGSDALMHQAAPQSQPIRVTVEDNGLGVCGFWIGVVSAVAAVIQVISIFVPHA
jgi:hypothetical protein